MARLIINASNIHIGGGKILLDNIISAYLQRSSDSCIMFIDERFDITDHFIQNVEFIKVRPSIIDRLRVDLQINRIVTKDDLVLYFGNLPPIIRIRGKVLLFLQNKFIVVNYPLKGFSLKSKIRLQLERIIFYLNKRNFTGIVVQTVSMRDAVLKKMLKSQCIFVIPFFSDLNLGKNRLQVQNKESGFLYVSSADPHKNNEVLINAWVYLATLNIFPTLYLTIMDDNSRLSLWIKKKINLHNLNIQLIAGIDRNQLLSYYYKCSALIYPSLFESFGLPLLEAKNRDLPIIASELDYVRDLVDPVETFDPNSSRSIARSVLRFLGIKSEKETVVDADSFLDQLFAITKN